MAFRLHELASYLGAEIIGDGDYEITGLASLANASSKDISFLGDSGLIKHLESCNAGAIIVAKENSNFVSGNALIFPTPYLGYARITQLFDNSPKPSKRIHPSAVVDVMAKIGKDVSIGANSVIEAGATVHDNSKIGANSFIGENVEIGVNAKISANVSIYHGVKVGPRAIIHSGAVIGADGFGFANDRGRWEKILHLGSVNIGNDVEIGACTTIDRGALDNTVIEDGVKIDNQVMVAHNVQIGAHSAIAGCVGISGSTKIGRYCTIAGGAGFVGHITIADRTHITCMTMVTKSITKPGSYSSGTGLMPTVEWKKNAVRMRQLDKLSKQVKRLEQQLTELKNQGPQE